MPDVLAIVSKAIFERDARVGGKVAGVGDVVPMDRYVSKNKGLSPVAEGGALFLVTVRPPDESLWLVAILEAPKFDGEQWVSAPNTAAIADIGALKSQITFANGSGISAKKGALGMSLQTPRALTEADVAMLFDSSPAPTKPPPPSAKKQPAAPPPSPPPRAPSTTARLRFGERVPQHLRCRSTSSGVGVRVPDPTIKRSRPSPTSPPVPQR